MAKHKIYLGTLLLVVAVLYGYRLDFPTAPYYDEVYHVASARNVLQGKAYVDVHPPLGHFVHAGSIALLGDQGWAWRISSLIAALLAILLLYCITQHLTGDRLASGIAAFIFAFDCISMTQARIMMHNSLMLSFMLLSLYLALKGADPKTSRRLLYFTLAGIALGLGLATRWIATLTLFPLGLILAHGHRYSKDPKPFIRHALIAFVIVPIATYAVIQLFLLMLDGFGWSSLIGNQTHMLRYHAGLKDSHPYGSQWWSWPLMTRPIWYFFERQDALVYGILSIGNPLVFWVIPLIILYYFERWSQSRSFVSGFILVGFLGWWLPWIFASRVKFFHYFYTAVPFVALALGIYLAKLWKNNRNGKKITLLYLALVLGMFLYWYPLLNAHPISEGFFQNHLWFKSWV